jgi:hypothetical protein
MRSLPPPMRSSSPYFSRLHSCFRPALHALGAQDFFWLAAMETPLHLTRSMPAPFTFLRKGLIEGHAVAIGLGVNQHAVAVKEERRRPECGTPPQLSTQ